MHCKENPIYVFLFWELRGLSPNFHIHLSVSDLYTVLYSQDRSSYFPAAEQADRSSKYINILQIYECRNWETEHYNSVLQITVSFLGYMNGNQTFILDSHQPFICSVMKSRGPGHLHPQQLNPSLIVYRTQDTRSPTLELRLESEGLRTIRNNHEDQDDGIRDSGQSFKTMRNKHDGVRESGHSF